MNVSRPFPTFPCMMDDSFPLPRFLTEPIPLQVSIIDAAKNSQLRHYPMYHSFTYCIQKTFPNQRGKVCCLTSILSLLSFKGLKALHQVSTSAKNISLKGKNPFCPQSISYGRVSFGRLPGFIGPVPSANSG
ncbi:hypothetical protein J2S21_003410 [Peribacillus cavernae]|nr:hypothetical protein [Peribacillus cavernae]